MPTEVRAYPRTTGSRRRPHTRGIAFGAGRNGLAVDNEAARLIHALARIPGRIRIPSVDASIEAAKSSAYSQLWISSMSWRWCPEISHGP